MLVALYIGMLNGLDCIRTARDPVQSSGSLELTWKLCA